MTYALCVAMIQLNHTYNHACSSRTRLIKLFNIKLFIAQLASQNIFVQNYKNNLAIYGIVTLASYCRGIL